MTDIIKAWHFVADHADEARKIIADLIADLEYAGSDGWMKGQVHSNEYNVARAFLANPALHDPDASSTDTWEAARLLDEINRLRADAARYAYLRDHMLHGVSHPHGSAIGMSEVLFGDDPDEAIDAAMKEEER